MGKLLRNVDTGIIALILLTSILAVFPANVGASPGPRIFLEDLPYGKNGQYVFDTTNVTTPFNVTIWVDTTAPFQMNMFQIYIIYDHRYINVTSVNGILRAWPNEQLGARNWNSQYVFYGGTGGAIGNPVYYNIDASHGAVMWGDLVGSDVTVSGKKMLARIEFKVVAYPPKGVGNFFESVLNINNDDTFIYSTLGAVPDVTKENGYYKLTWAVPPNVTPAVDPTLVQFGPWPPSAVGQDFDVKLLIKGVNPAWDMVYADLSLCFNNTVIDIVGGEANVTVDSLWTTYSVVVEPGVVHISVSDPTATPSGDVLVATIKFTVMFQAESPPYPTDWVDVSPLNICEVAIGDHTMPIPYNPPINGTVKVKALLALPLPWLELDPSSVTLGPEPAVGKEFEVKVKICNLHFAWYMIAYQFVLHYDQSLLKCVEITEGPFLKNRLWNLYGTYFMPYSDPEPYDITVGGMLIPNPETNQWDQTNFPDTIYHPTIDNTLAIIKFKAIKQIAHYDLTDILYLDEFDQYLLSKDGTWIPVDKSKFVNCTYTIKGTPLIGAYLDLYGGANNAGYGATIFPEPYGGQGLNKPMDLVIPQSEVYLFANLTYNYWPVQNKEVSFEIIDNKGNTWGKFVALTNSKGVASITIRMPWVCENPQQYIGVWTVVATARVGDTVVTDTMTFHYDYMIHIWKVTTDKYYYAHEEYIKVTVEYGTHAQQYYPALFTVTVTDELGVPIGIDASTTLQVGGATYCQYKNGTFTIRIFIPKFAFAGYAYIHVCSFDKEPAVGGFAWCPEYEPVEIYILPK